MSRIEVGVSDLFALFRRKGALRAAPADPRRSIARPVSGPMFTGQVETMSLPRAKPRRESVRKEPPRANPAPSRQTRQDPTPHDPARPEPTRNGPARSDQLRNDHGEPARSENRNDQRSEPRPRRDPPRPEPARREPERRQERPQERPQERQQERQEAHRGDDARRAGTQGFLAAHAVERSFVGRKVVKGVSLYVRRGEAVGLLGPNGAGKTTVFYMITGLITADRGRIELDGHDVTALPMYQRARLGIGYLPQEASIFRGLNVEENIRAVLEVVEPSRKRREYDLDALLEEFNITRLRKTPSIALSGGERRRVEIARALATRPNYMLLDEPFAGIDPIAVGDIQALVRHLTQRGIGVLITDHNVRETLGLTDRAYIIYSGEVLMEGQAEDIVNNPDVRRLYLGEEFRMF
jgi:lipopolysaccharide export system ATP-binding protein